MPELNPGRRLLFHAFPGPSRRAGREGREARRVGVAQLDLMMRYGLLLTPERLTIPMNEAAVNREAPKVDFHQARACLTLVEDRDELWRKTRLDELGQPISHVDLFGEFAVGIDPIRARELGAIPVIYFYSGVNAAHGRVSHEILFTLRELRSLAIALARLEAKAEIGGRDILDAATLDAVGYDLEGDPIVRARVDETDRRTARVAVDLLDTDRRPAWNLVDMIDAMLDLFQTVDSRSCPESLAYYHEREWRIAPLFSAGVRCRRLCAEKASGEAEPPSWVNEMRAELRALDGDFFTERVLDDSAILHGTAKEAFFDFVEEIVCPADSAEDVAQLLRGRGILGRARRCGGPVVFVLSERRFEPGREERVPDDV
ncbi:MAG: hypothetical protein OXF93_22590 [Acidobacteria bacterium]|nr:hypothetical protein [Acidobacteriota bacterium]